MRSKPKTTNEPQIRTITYNTKSKKGTYIGVQYPGQRERQYKEEQNVPLDLYLTAAKEQWTPTILRANIKKYTTPPIKPLTPKKNVKAERISTQFKSGNTTAFYRLDLYNRAITKKNIATKLYLPLLHDKRALGIIERNIQKLRNRHSYTLQIYGSEKNKPPQIIGTITDIGRRTPEELYHLYHERLGYKNGELLAYGRIASDTALLGLPKGSGKQVKGDMTISHVIVQAMFQRG